MGRRPAPPSSVEALNRRALPEAEKGGAEQDTKLGRGELLALTAEIVPARAGAHGVDPAQPGAFIGSVFRARRACGEGSAAPTEPTSAAPIGRAVTDEHVVRPEDGETPKTRERRPTTARGTIPERCRAGRGLKADHPMVAPAHARGRRAAAIGIGLGRKRDEPVDETPAPKPKAKRKAA